MASAIGRRRRFERIRPLWHPRMAADGDRKKHLTPTLAHFAGSKGSNRQ